MTTRVYLDWNATSPPLEAVVAAMADAARAAWANPASIHGHGRAARAIVEDARAAVAELGSSDPRDVVLTSGGTEANNLALWSHVAGAGDAVLFVSRLEHPSITRVAEAIAARGGARVTWIATREDGTIDVDDLSRHVATVPESTRVVVALQAVNHETGVVQPLDDVIPLVRARHGGSRVHVDAVQAFGRVDDVLDAVARADTASLAGHKIRGPKGIGALVGRATVKLEPLLLGGAQERGIRPGTVDPMAAAGLAVAARHARGGPERYRAVAALRDRLEAACVARGAAINGADAKARAPHVVNASFAGWNGAELVAALDLDGVSASSGSACSAGTIEPSPVIHAMRGEARARSAVRFSLGEETRTEDVDRAIAVLAAILAR
jgi:cysteine desulfurase